MTISLKILVLGTSITATPFWAGELKAGLEKCLQRDVAIQAVAKAGATSRWGLSQAQQIILAKPDVLLIEFAANDASLRRFLSLSESKQNHAAIIREVRLAKPDTKIFLLAINPTWGFRGYWIRPRLNVYYGLYSDLAKTSGVGFIDVRPRWDWNTIGETVPDGLHPTVRAMTEIVAPYLVEAVCSQMNIRH